MRLLSNFSALAAALATGASAQGTFIGGGPRGDNVLNNYCNRWSHQSTLKSGSNIYIDGGVQVFTNFTGSDPNNGTPTGNTTTGQNNYIIQTPTNYTWDATQNLTQVAYPKLNTTILTDTHPPIMKKGALFAGANNDSRIWLFGGTTAYEALDHGPNFTYPISRQYGLWSFDTTSHIWQAIDVRAASPERPYNGFTADVPSRGMGFWINGAVDSGSSSEAQVLGSYHEIFQPGMLVFDFNGPQPVVYNITGPAWGPSRVGGLLEYVPTFGTHGILVAFGGGKANDMSGNANGDQGDYVDPSEVWVYDLAQLASNGTTWYMIHATGDLPTPRQDSCAVGFAAPDNSSYQIYTYGGRFVNDVNAEIYALSLPSFTWSQINVTNTGTPRWGHTCQRAGASQMIVVGGANDVSNQSDCDAERRGLGVYDFHEHRWSAVHKNGSQAAYTVPPAVTGVIGGTATGNATLQAPQNGWPSNGLAQVFGQTGPDSNQGLGGGAIAGIVVGVVVGVALVALLVWWFLRRRRRARKAVTAKELDTAGQSVELDEMSVVKAKEEPPAAPVEVEATAAAASSGYPVEKAGGAARTELPAAEPVYEMDASTAVELPGEHVDAKTGR